MKRTLSRLLALVPLALLLAALFCLTAQADPPDSQCPSPFSSDGHHTWHVRDYQKPTCTKRGYKLWVCVDCDDTYRETLPATGHEYEWKTTKAATCAKNGTRQQVCKVCGAKGDTATVKATGKHTWEWQTVKAATCGADGSRQQVCKVCKAKGKTETVKATGKHTWEWQSVKAATCGADGSRRQVCKVCGAKGKTEAVAATGKHSWGEWKDTKAAACEKAGEQARVCSVCKQTETKPVPAPGHAWDGGVMTREPGFLNPGETTYTCARCGETKTEAIPAKELPDFLQDPGPVSVMKNDLPLLIVAHPEGGSIARGSDETLTLTVEASGGTKPYTYKWYREYIGGSTWSGFYTWWADTHRPLKADGNTCEAAAANFAYYCKVTDDEGNCETSYKADVYYTLHFERQPENVNMYGDDTVALYCKAADGVPFDNGTYMYAWYKEDGSMIDLTDYGMTLVSDEGRYYCTVQDCNGGIVTSDTITVYSTEPLAVTGLSDKAINEGETAGLSVEVSGGVPPYSYQWGTREKKDDYYVSFDALEGETSDSLEVPFSALGYYAVDVTDAMKATVRVNAEVKEYKEPLIIKYSKPTEFTTEKDALFYCKVSEDEVPITSPLTFTLLKEGKKVESDTTKNTWKQFSISEAGIYAIHVEDADGRTAETEYLQITDNRLKVTGVSDEVCMHELGIPVILEAKVEGGRAPYKYQWVKTESLAAFEEAFQEYITKDSKLSEYLDRYPVSEPFTTWSLTVKDADGATATAYPIKVTYDKDMVLITKQPEDVQFEFEKNASYYTVLSCEAWSSQGHTLKYYWQQKFDDGWRFVTWLSQEPGPELPTSHGGTFRCKITDLTTGKETYTRVAEVKMPKVQGRAKQEYNSTTINLSVWGGTGPYEITCKRSYRSFTSTLTPVQEEGFPVWDYIHLDAYDEKDPHWAEYTLTGVSKHKKTYMDGDYNYRHYAYEFKITDSVGNVGYAYVKMKSPMNERYTPDPA